MSEFRQGGVLHVAGARPNFPKMAAVHRALSMREIPQGFVHTGQHFDEALSTSFFKQLGIPEPDVNLDVSSTVGVDAIARTMLALRPMLERMNPACVVVYGDVNSTLAAALTAQKVGTEVVHVEAGLRSGDRRMPEEINRILVDRLCDRLYATCDDAVENLLREGASISTIEMVGNPMIDTLLRNMDSFDVESVRSRLGLAGQYGVATIHRPSNVDNLADVAEVVESIHQIADLVDVVFPTHPRGRRQLAAAGLESHPGVKVVDPLRYFDFMGLVRGASLVVTDSGGVQEETTMLGIPCLTLRDNTERPVTISCGTNRLIARGEAGAAAKEALSSGSPVLRIPRLWDGKAGERIADSIIALYSINACAASS